MLNTKRTLILYTIIFLTAHFTFAQSVRETYNDIYNRYEYHNSDNQLVGYKKKDIITGDWVYTTISDKSSSNSHRSPYRHLEPVDVFDEDLALQVLLSRSRSSGRSSYSKKKQWVYAQTYSKLKKFDQVKKNNYKSQKRENKLNRKKVKNAKLFFPSSLPDGWYKCYTEIPVFFDEKENIFLLSRYVQITNGKLISYLGLENNFHSIVSFQEDYSGIDAKIRIPDGRNVDIRIRINDPLPSKESPYFEIPQHIMFYQTSDNGGGKVRVNIKGKTNSFSFINKVLSEKPSCNQIDGIGKFYLTPGKYEYFAHNKQGFWEGEFEVGNNCYSIHLLNRSN